MTKSAKRKAARQADFQKAKLKLGKGKQAANNATDTSFRAKSIALPQQSINLDRSQAYTTRRGQTLNDLSVQTKHHSPAIKKDALEGIKELLVSYPHLARSPSSLRLVIPAILHLIGDEDTRVRGALLSFAAWLFPLIAAPSSDALSAEDPSSKSESLLQPYLSQLLLYATSAMSHIYMAVRIDAVKFLDVLMTSTGSAGGRELVKGWNNVRADDFGSKLIIYGEAGHAGSVLRCLLNMLGLSSSISGTSARRSNPSSINSGTSELGATNSMDLSLSSRLVVLNAIRSYLRIITSLQPGTEGASTGTKENEAMGSTGSAASTMYEDCPTWIFNSSFASPSDFEAFQQVLRIHANGPAACRQKRILNISAASTSALAYEAIPTLLDDHGDRGSLVDLQGSVSQTFQAGDLLQFICSASTLGTSDGPRGRQLGSAANAFQALFVTLGPTLINIFIEVAPDAVAHLHAVSLALPQSSSTDKQINTQGKIACALLDIALCLIRAANLSDTSSSAEAEALKQVSALLERVSRYFPFGPTSSQMMSSNLSVQAQQQLQTLNLSYCELCARLSATNDLPVIASSSKDRWMQAVSVRLKHVQQYVSELLSASVESGALPLSTESLASILPTVWLLLSLRGVTGTLAADADGREDEAGALVQSLTERFAKMASTDSAKGVLFAFLARLSIIESYPSYQGNYRASQSPLQTASLRRFVCELPRYLWDTASKREGTAEKIIAYLRLIALNEELDIFAASDLNTVQEMLVPFFTARAGGRFLAQRVDLSSLIDAMHPLLPSLQSAVSSSLVA
ncbi:hypothetical protein K437DRAFT_143603 [Tilletiaria anomala UBC 951]|uniref:Pre-rRNA-processing protein n=1 Tax=Tilletiaria anomala (strain ATCC 24038 / CBS 436.72 / UBC 951) TaxID=1037660 RepID=A0A066VR64_TILAU|nr:uncharacterized protein K437DRAFT_143603 [Tilletiaria anomala UBC 951]KDN43941.1 hypothetical protein K437DRAFT_143603 [Tilletiaria anomala UBC 951]